MSNNVLKRGGNAILNYRQSIDHIRGGNELDKVKKRLLVVRAYGTAVKFKQDLNLAASKSPKA